MIDKRKFLGVLKNKLKDLVQRKVQDGDESGLARHRQVILASVVIMQEFCNGILFPALEVIVDEMNEEEKKEGSPRLSSKPEEKNCLLQKLLQK